MGEELKSRGSYKSGPQPKGDGAACLRSSKAPKENPHLSFN